MADPWTIIGWLLLGAAALWLLAKILGWIVPPLLRYVAHRLTRHVAPKGGQVWDQGGSRLYIDHITDAGRIHIRAGSARWTDSPEEWAARVRNRRLILIEGGSRG